MESTPSFEDVYEVWDLQVIDLLEEIQNKGGLDVDTAYDILARYEGIRRFPLDLVAPLLEKLSPLVPETKPFWSDFSDMFTADLWVSRCKDLSGSILDQIFWAQGLLWDLDDAEMVVAYLARKDFDVPVLESEVHKANYALIQGLSKKLVATEPLSKIMWKSLSGDILSPSAHKYSFVMKAAS